MPKITFIDLQEEPLAESNLASAGDVSLLSPALPKKSVFTFFRRFAPLFFSLVTPKNLPVNILAALIARASIMGEIAPFGLAFFAAALSAAPSKERSGAIGVWALAGVLAGGHYWEAIIYAVSMVLYWQLAPKLARWQKSIHTVPLFFLSSVFLAGLALMYWRDTSLYGFLLALADAVFCLALIYIFQYGMPLVLGLAQMAENVSEQFVCLMLMLSVAVAGLNSLVLFGYNLNSIVGSLLVLALALAGGAGVGAAVGVAIGFVNGLNGVDAAASIAMYALAGLVGGILREFGKPAVGLGFLLGNTIFLLYVAQSNILSVPIAKTLTEPALGCLLFLALPTRSLLKTGETYFEPAAPPIENLPQISAAAEKLDYIAEMLENFGDTVRAASNSEQLDYNNKIKDNQLNEMLAIVGGKVCDPCRHRNDCWDKEFYPIYQSMLEMLSLAEDKELTEKKVPLPIKSYCTNKGALVDIINQVVESNQIHWYWQRKLTDCRLSAAEQLKATAAIVANLALEINREPRNDVEVADRLKTQAEALGCTLHDVKVEGNGDMVSVNVRKNPCNNNKECFNTVLPLTANLLKEAMTLSHECGVKSKNKSCKLLMSLAERYTVEFGAASAAKGDGNKIKNSVCGDSFAHLKLSQGKEALILSDGMGSGPLAADESSAAVLFLKKLLLAGFDVGVAVKTVNSMLLLKTSPESFATMDMVIIDAYTCATEFLKVGSAPSFIKRVREVSTIDCSSLPAGIIGEIEIAPVKKRLAPGDIIVMVSDGILERPGALNKESWIVNYLRRLDSDIPQDIAASILRQAKKLNGDPITDDMTVIVAKIAERAPAA